MSNFWPKKWSRSLKKFEWWSLTRELLKQHLTEKQNGCLRSGRLREVVAMKELTVLYTTFISVNQCRRDQETYQSGLPAEIWYQELLIMTNRDVCHHCYCYTKHALKYFG